MSKSFFPFNKFFLGLILSFFFGNAQCQDLHPTATYPKITGYFSIINPIFAFNKDELTPNFKNSYVVGFPVGINILKSDKIGFSFEITPFIKAENNDSKVSYFLFHPGVLFRYPKGFTIATRAAFETSGRYGCTLIFSKIIIRNKTNSFFIATPIPARFGNQMPASLGLGVQIGILF